jgi:hypothetical protein
LSCQHAISAVPAGSCPACDDPADLGGYLSLADCLDCLPDRGAGPGCGTGGVLAFAVAAVMAGADSVAAVAEWASDVPPEVLAALGARRDRRGRLVPPSLAAFRRLLRQLDGQALAAAFGTWLKAQVMAGLADAGTLVIALDGKTVRGARGRDGKAPHLLAAMITGARAVLAQKDIDAKTNEITQVKPLLDDIDITGALRDPHDGQLRSAVAALGITSRSLRRGGTPAVIAAAARGHWDIEVLHYVRDVTMREDAQRLRAGTGPLDHRHRRTCRDGDPARQRRPGRLRRRAGHDNHARHEVRG